MESQEGSIDLTHKVKISIDFIWTLQKRTSQQSTVSNNTWCISIVFKSSIFILTYMLILVRKESSCLEIHFPKKNTLRIFSLQNYSQWTPFILISNNVLSCPSLNTKLKRETDWIEMDVDEQGSMLQLNWLIAIHLNAIMPQVK